MSDYVQSDLFAATASKLQQFERWKQTAEGRHTCSLFMRLACGLYKGGRRRIGAKAIVERIRWHYNVRRGRGASWKVNNNHTAYLARWAMSRRPELAGVFATRAVGRPDAKQRVYIIKPEAKTA